MKPWKQIVSPTAQEIAPKTLVEILGNRRVLVEHHKGVLGYGTEEIILGATFGLVRICGMELRLCWMNREQVFVGGRIDAVYLEGGHG